MHETGGIEIEDGEIPKREIGVSHLLGDKKACLPYHEGSPPLGVIKWSFTWIVGGKIFFILPSTGLRVYLPGLKLSFRAMEITTPSRFPLFRLVFTHLYFYEKLPSLESSGRRSKGGIKVILYLCLQYTLLLFLLYFPFRVHTTISLDVFLSGPPTRNMLPDTQQPLVSK